MGGGREEQQHNGQHGLEPYAYLRCLFTQLPIVKEQSEYRALLPQYIDPDLLKSSQAEPQVGIN